MPDSTNPTDVAFLKKCHDLMALLDHTERLLRRQLPAQPQTARPPMQRA